MNHRPVLNKTTQCGHDDLYMHHYLSLYVLVLCYVLRGNDDDNLV